MNQAQMIAKAWLDEAYRDSLIAAGIEVPEKPEDLVDDDLDVLVMDGDRGGYAPQTCC